MTGLTGTKILISLTPLIITLAVILLFVQGKPPNYTVDVLETAAARVTGGDLSFNAVPERSDAWQHPLVQAGKKLPSKKEVMLRNRRA